MSRLDSAIRRLQAQRAALDLAAARIAGLDGPVLEIGLGNGRTFDHLRERLGGRPIWVFDRAVAAHPDCIPDPAFTLLGDFRETLPAFAARFAGRCALAHLDIGTGDKAASAALAAELAPAVAALLAPAGLAVSDQPLPAAALAPLPPPPGQPPGRIHLYRRWPAG